MKKQVVTILKFLFFLSLGVLLIWLAVKDKTQEEWDSIDEAFSKANYFWIVLSVVISILSHFIRALRWKQLLQPMNHHPKLYNTYFAVMVGYLANSAIHRLGEVSRCGVLNRYEKIPFTEGFGTVITERVIDLLTVILIFFLILAMEFDKIAGISNDLIFKNFSQKINALANNTTMLIIVVSVLLVVVGIFYYFRKKIRSLFSDKVKGFFTGLLVGLKSIKEVKSPMLFILYSILIWLMYALQAYACFFAFDETSSLGFGVSLVLVVFGGIAVVVVPGGTGVYQAIVIQVLTTVYLISETNSFAFAWACWTTQFLVILLFGLLSLILLPLLNKTAKIA